MENTHWVEKPAEIDENYDLPAGLGFVIQFIFVINGG